jgi:large subunit ribosomal protein L4
MTIDILNIQGEKTGKTVELPANIFGIEPNEHVLYLAVKQYLANQRQGTHKAKERSEVAGSTRKLHKQKGTGGSRKGDINSPLYPGGGRVFGPRVRDYEQKLNKKVKKLARRSALSSKAKAGAIVVVEDFTFESPKTKDYLNVLKNLNIDGKKSLVVTAEFNPSVHLSSRNLPTSRVIRAQDLNTYEILKANAIVLAAGSIEKLMESLA